MDMPLRVNNEGETPKQEKMEGPESAAKERAEMKAAAPKPKVASSMFDAKPGASLAHESKFKK